MEKVLKVTWLERRTNASILQEIKPSCSLEALATKYKLTYFRHIMRRSRAMEKAIMLGIVEGKRGRGRRRMRWHDEIK